MSATVAVKPELDFNKIAAAMQAAAAFANEEVVATQAMSENRPVLVGRVIRVIESERYGNKAELTLEDPTAAYDSSQKIKNYRDAVIGRVDKASNTLSVTPTTLDDYASKMCEATEAVREDEERVAAYQRQLQSAIDDGNVAKRAALEAQPIAPKYPKGFEMLFDGDEQRFEPGKQFLFKLDDTINPRTIKKFALVKVGISATRYAMLDSASTPGRAFAGVVFKIKQCETLESANQRKVVQMFMKHPGAFSLPLPTPPQVCADNDYFSPTTKKTAEQRLFIPLIPDQKRRIEVFASGARGAGCQTAWMMGERSHSYAKRNTTESKKWLKADLKVVDWADSDALLAQLFKRTLCTVISFDPLGFLKLDGVDLSAAVAPVVLRNAEMVLQASIELQETLKSPTNNLDPRVVQGLSGEYEAWSADNGGASLADFLSQRQHDWFMALRIDDFMCDFPAFLAQSGVPLSLTSVQAMARQERLRSFTTDKAVDDKTKPASNRVTRNVFEDADLSYFPLNEMDDAALRKFLAGEAASKDYDYIALVSVEDPGELYSEALASLRAFAEAKGDDYAGVLGGPLLHPNTMPRPDGVKRYCEKVLELADDADFDALIPADHPLVEMPLQCMLGKGDVFVVYAVDRAKRASIVRDADLNPIKQIAGVKEEKLAIAVAAVAAASEGGDDRHARSTEDAPETKRGRVNSPVDGLKSFVAVDGTLGQD